MLVSVYKSVYGVQLSMRVSARDWNCSAAFQAQALYR